MRVSKFRAKEWLQSTSGEALSVLVADAVSSVSIVTHGLQGAAGNASSFTKPTVVRIIGAVYCNLLKAPAGLAAVSVHMGFLRVSAAVGLPIDFTTNESQGWLWSGRTWLRAANLDETAMPVEASGVGQRWYFERFDIRVGRKLEPEQRIDFMITNTTAIAGQGSSIRWAMSARVLIAE